MNYYKVRMKHPELSSISARKTRNRFWKVFYADGTNTIVELPAVNINGLEFAIRPQLVINPNNPSAIVACTQV